EECRRLGDRRRVRVEEALDLRPHPDGADDIRTRAGRDAPAGLEDQREVEAGPRRRLDIQRDAKRHDTGPADDGDDEPEEAPEATVGERSAESGHGAIVVAAAVTPA